jgi:two-component system sensor histidine kinase QseC
MKPYGLQARLAITVILVCVLGLFGSAGFYHFEVLAVLDDLSARSLQSQVRELVAAIRSGEAGAIEVALPPPWRKVYTDKGSGFQYAIYTADGRLLATSPNASQPLAMPAAGAVGKLQFSGLPNERTVAFSQRAAPDMVVVVARERIEEEALVDSLLGEQYEHVVVVLLPMVVLTTVVAWFVVGWSLRPLKRASAEAASIVPGNTSARIGIEGLPDEMRPLVEAMNGALDRLSAAYAAERRFAADAAHEMRTPLAVLYLRLQEARLQDRPDWSAIELDMAHLRRLVNQLLELARKESNAVSEARGPPSPVNMARLARETAALLLPLAEEERRELDVEAPETAMVEGHTEDLRDMVRNLIENALVHGRGNVTVSVEDGEDVLVEVADEGSGIAPELRETVFKRFYKVSSATPGAGLGLSIVRQVARTHGGEVSFVPGEGCRIRVKLPRGGRPSTSALAA